MCMTVPMWFNLPMVDSRSSLVHEEGLIIDSMSFDQSRALSNGKYTRNRRVSICQPRIILRSDRRPSARCFFIDMMGCRGVASWGSMGRVMASNASGIEWVMRRRLLPVSVPAWKMSSMKLSVTMSRGGRGMDSGSAGAHGMFGGRSICGSVRNGKDDERVEGSQEGAQARSWAISVMESLMSLKMEGAAEEPNGSRVRR